MTVFKFDRFSMVISANLKYSSIVVPTKKYFPFYFQLKKFKILAKKSVSWRTKCVKSSHIA